MFLSSAPDVLVVVRGTLPDGGHWTFGEGDPVSQDISVCMNRNRSLLREKNNLFLVEQEPIVFLSEKAPISVMLRFRMVLLWDEASGIV